MSLATLDRPSAQRTHQGIDLRDPVVTYDVMREAANRLVGLYAQQVTVGGTGDPAIIAMRALRDEVYAVPTHDLDAQELKTIELRERYDRLANAR